ncbi:sporulation integral membrane protein YtvI [Listeria booriae]|uniref:sporulation integral membrane protein YtvI n=1 Tax=Listeria booriae TaxID=1552123 RepID=UPI001629E3E0|nr:sporulation integral membrane protein YtvI [Listeria booriae]MBC1811855.1 sporulation integral membrane protein YtvI [Listeria booriae]MDT0111943.1 sporulation integral membrane protein YtvI [Listeria booriae]
MEAKPPVTKKHDLQKQKQFLIRFLYIASIVCIIFLALKYVLPLLYPFLIGFVLAWMCMPLTRLLARKTGWRNRKAWGLIVMLVFYAVVSTLLILGILELFHLLGSSVGNLPSYYQNDILPALQRIEDWGAEWIHNVAPELADQYLDVFHTIIAKAGAFVISLSGSIASWIANVTLSLPSMFIFFSFSMLFSFFIVWDFDKVGAFIRRQLPDRVNRVAHDVHQHFKTTTVEYIKAYLIIAGITCVELFIGLTILGVPNAIWIALGISVFDMLPVFGTGGIMIPWVLLTFINGDFSFAIELLILYTVITIIRNFIEPKILGTKLGLNPVVALFTMYVGLQLFGIIGLILAPIVTVIVKDFHDAGRFKLWKYE